MEAKGFGGARAWSSPQCAPDASATAEHTQWLASGASAMT